MDNQALTIIGFAIAILGFLSNLVWKKWYVPRYFESEPINAEVIAVKRPTSEERQKSGTRSYLIRVVYEAADGSKVTTQLRAKDERNARLPESIIEAAGGTLNVGKVVNRFQEAAEISRRMSAEGKSKDEIKQAVQDLSEQRIGAVKDKTEDLGLSHRWRAVSEPTTIPIFVSKKNNKKVVVHRDGLSHMRS